MCALFTTHNGKILQTQKTVLNLINGFLSYFSIYCRAKMDE